MQMFIFFNMKCSNIHTHIIYYHDDDCDVSDFLELKDKRYNFFHNTFKVFPNSIFRLFLIQKLRSQNIGKKKNMIAVY